MSKFLLDTNFLIHFSKEDESARLFLKHHPISQIYICSIVEAELYYGAWNSSQTKKTFDVLEKLLVFQSFPFDSTVARIYGRVRSDLKKAGTPIGPNDLMIASIALSNQATVVTRNVKEFSRVSGLQVIGY